MRNIWTLLFFSIFVSCTTSSKKWDTSPIASNEKLYVVNIDEAPKEDIVNLSSFLQDIKTIVLETNDGCLIGEVNSIRVLDDYVVVMDSRKTESVLVFDKEGRFLHKIGQIGQGPSEYMDITDSSIDFEKKEIYLLDFSTDKVLKYNIASGEFISSINIESDDFDNYCMHYLDGKIYTSAIPFMERDDSFLLQQFNADTGKSETSYLSASAYNKGWNSFFTRTDGFFYPNEDGSAQYVQIFMDTVISIKENEIMPYLAIESKNWITEKDIRDLIEYKAENEGTMSLEILYKRDISYDIHHYFESGNIICFQYQNAGDMEFVIYDKESNTTRRAGFFKDDLVYSGDWFLLPTFAYADSRSVYSYLRPEQIPRFLEIANTGGLNAGLDKREVLEKLPEDSNPVIFCYSVKK